MSRVSRPTEQVQLVTRRNRRSDWSGSADSRSALNTARSSGSRPARLGGGVGAGVAAAGRHRRRPGARGEVGRGATNPTRPDEGWSSGATTPRSGPQRSEDTRGGTPARDQMEADSAGRERRRSRYPEPGAFAGRPSSHGALTATVDARLDRAEPGSIVAKQSSRLFRCVGDAEVLEQRIPPSRVCEVASVSDWGTGPIELTGWHPGA